MKFGELLQLLNDTYQALATMQMYVDGHREGFKRGENKHLDQLKQRVAEAVVVLNGLSWEKEVA
jgi:hypothetical protein